MVKFSSRGTLTSKKSNSKKSGGTKMVTKLLNYKMSSDQGNSEHAFKINGELHRSPNVISSEIDRQVTGDKPLDVVVNTLLDNLFVSFPVNNNAISTYGNYYIGQSALTYGNNIENLRAGVDKKSDVDLPVMSILGNLAGKAVQDAFKKKGELPKKIEVLKADLATALPVKEYLIDGSVKKLTSKLMDNSHSVIVFVGKEKVQVDIEFDFVKVLPEGTAVLFSLMDSPSINSELINVFSKQYTDITKDFFKNARLLHIDIGDGTTETVISQGYDFDEENSSGISVGIARAIEQALPKFMEIENLPEITRQKFSEYLRYPEKHKVYGPKARKYVNQTIEPQVNKIMDQAKRVLDKVVNEVDGAIVYGGGSILSREVLEPKLKNELSKRLDGTIKLLWVPKELAPVMNIEGLDTFLNSKIFSALKKSHVTVSN